MAGAITAPRFFVFFRWFESAIRSGEGWAGAMMLLTLNQMFIYVSTEHSSVSSLFLSVPRTGRPAALRLLPHDSVPWN